MLRNKEEKREIEENRERAMHKKKKNKKHNTPFTEVK